MLYNLLKIPARLAFLIYCRSLRISRKEALNTKGPLLICANHPDSLLDAIILSTLFKSPVHSLARGDAFKNKFYASLLRSIHMMPVYRVSEGVENLEQNYETFDACKKIFEKGGVVLIFSEGRCINEWRLRPLMKGTARLAISSWQEGINLSILPVGINYQSFHSFGKNIHLNFGEIFNIGAIKAEEGFGKAIISFNDKLRLELSKLVIEISKDDMETRRKKFYVPQPFLKKLLLFVPAIVGYLFHFLLYVPIQKLAWKKASLNDHYDSLIVAILIFLYPLYLILFFFIIFSLTGSLWSFLIFIGAPMCAWSYVQLKKQF